MAVHTRATPGVYAIDRSPESRSGTVIPVSILPPRCSAKAGSVSKTGPATVSGTGSGLMTLLTASALTHYSGPTSRPALPGDPGTGRDGPGGLSFWVVGRGCIWPAGRSTGRGDAERTALHQSTGRPVAFLMTIVGGPA